MTITTMFRMRKPTLLRLHFPRSFTISSTSRTNAKTSPQRTYKWMSPDVESVEQYKPGGYCPVDIADEIHNSQYRIIHKLGFGSFSTVWLAEDRNDNRLVALKFLRADNARNTPESEILQHLRASHPSNPFVVDLLDEFTVKSANGSHRCLVSEALGPSIGSVLYESINGSLPGAICRSVAAQCVRGLAHLHSCGVVHGDFHTGNILFTMPDLENWTAAQVYERFGTPDLREIKRVDGMPVTQAAPKHAVFPPDPVALLPFCLTDSCMVKIGDFGNASRPDARKLVRNIDTAVGVAAPEILFNDVAIIGMPADTWALACTLYEILGDRRLLQSFMQERDEIIVEMVRTLGKLPDPWWRAWAARSSYFEDDGSFKPTPDNICGEPRRVNLETRVSRLLEQTISTPEYQLDRQESMVLETMLEAMLRYEPADRAQVVEIVRMLPTTW